MVQTASYTAVVFWYVITLLGQPRVRRLVLVRLPVQVRQCVQIEKKARGKSRGCVREALLFQDTSPRSTAGELHSSKIRVRGLRPENLLFEDTSPRSTSVELHSSKIRVRGLRPENLTLRRYESEGCVRRTSLFRYESEGCVREVLLFEDTVPYQPLLPLPLPVPHQKRSEQEQSPGDPEGVARSPVV